MPLRPPFKKTGLKQYKLEIQSEQDETKSILILDLRKKNSKLFDQSSNEYREVISGHIDRFIEILQTFKKEILENGKESKTETD